MCWKKAVVTISFFLTSCVSAPIAPNLKLPEKEFKQLMMPPVADQVYLKIDGNKVEADEHGYQLLRFYVAARSMLK